MSKLVKVRFYGALAEDLGRAEWAFAVSSPAEALQAIEANTGNMVSALFKNWGAEYFVAINGKPVKTFEEMSIMHHRDLETIDFMPVFKGAGSDGWMILVGVLLIALVVVAPYAGVGIGLSTSAGVVGSTAAVGTMGALAGTLIAGVGISLIASGVASLLAPTPSDDLSEKPENTPSYIFNGAINTYQQGNPVPIGFGRLKVGSQVISAGVRSVDVDARQT